LSGENLAFERTPKTMRKMQKDMASLEKEKRTATTQSFARIGAQIHSSQTAADKIENIRYISKQKRTPISFVKIKTSLRVQMFMAKSAEKQKLDYHR
jgi:hypothetical protein